MSELADAIALAVGDRRYSTNHETVIAVLQRQVEAQERIAKQLERIADDIEMSWEWYQRYGGKS